MKAIPNFSNYRVNAEGAVETVNNSKVLKARNGKLNMLNDSGNRVFVEVSTIEGVSTDSYGETAKPKAAPKAKAKAKAEPKAKAAPKAEPKAEPKAKAEPTAKQKEAAAKQKARAEKANARDEARAKKEADKAAAKEAKAKAREEAKEAKAEAKAAKPAGVIQSICNIVCASKKGITAEGVLDELQKLFPHRERASMQNTVRAQIGSKKGATRMERERKINFAVSLKTKDGDRLFKLLK